MSYRERPEPPRRGDDRERGGRDASRYRPEPPRRPYDDRADGYPRQPPQPYGAGRSDRPPPPMWPDYRDEGTYSRGPAASSSSYQGRSVPPQREQGRAIPPPREDRGERDWDYERSNGAAGNGRNWGDEPRDRYAERGRERDGGKGRGRSSRSRSPAPRGGDRRREASPPSRTSGSSSKGDHLAASNGISAKNNGTAVAAEPMATEAAPEANAADEKEDGAPVDEAEAAMMASMGFGGFGTTKGTHVKGNSQGGANVKKERTWRQYMNRKGGFNRQLDAVKK